MLRLGDGEPSPAAPGLAADVLLSDFVLPPEDAPEPPTPPEPSQPPPATLPPPIAAAPPPAATAPPPEPRVRLGVDQSTAQTENWLGFKDPTPHAAPKSEVEQPALDPNAGAPGQLAGGSPGDAGDAASQAPPSDAPLPMDAPAAPPAPADTPSPSDPSTEPVPAPDTTPPPSETPPPPQTDPLRTDPAQPREGETDGVDDPPPPGAAPSPTDTQPGEPLRPPSPLPVGPDRPDGVPDPNAPIEPVEQVLGFVGPPAPDMPGFSAPTPIPPRPARATAPPVQIAPPQRQVLPPPTPPPTPRVTPPTPLIPPMTPGAPARPQAPAAGSGSASGAATTPGSGVEHAGEVSEKESDASSLEDPIEVRPGRPAAAEGIELITRRPQFSRYTRTVAAPRNPLLRVTFDPRGVVVDVQLIRSSGFNDVDDPVVNAVFQWQARGERLKRAGPAGLTLTVEILLR